MKLLDDVDDVLRNIDRNNFKYTRLTGADTIQPADFFIGLRGDDSFPHMYYIKCLEVEGPHRYVPYFKQYPAMTSWDEVMVIGFVLVYFCDLDEVHVVSIRQFNPNIELCFLNSTKTDTIEEAINDIFPVWELE